MAQKNLHGSGFRDSPALLSWVSRSFVKQILNFVINTMPFSLCDSVFVLFFYSSELVTRLSAEWKI